MVLCSILRPSLPHRLSLRCLGTVASRSAAVKEADVLSATLSFEDPRAFRVKSWGELLRALGIFRLCSFSILVNNCGKLMSVTRTLLGSRGFSFLLKPTVYAQFVAGENESEISESMKKMSSLGLRPMLAVPIEEVLGESTGEQQYDKNMETMLECVKMSSSNTWSVDPMMQLKITALLSSELIALWFDPDPVLLLTDENKLLVSKVKLTTLMSQRSYNLSLLVKAMDGQHVSFPGLKENEAAHFLCGLQRLNTIAEASVNKVRVLVDAEYTYINPALSLVTMAMMMKFNKDGAWIWNTYQCYLKESRSLLLEALRLSETEGFCLGVKLVRGAYMDKERKQAKREGQEDPVHRSWEDTNNSYNGSLDLMLDVISEKPENYRIIVATHNEESVRRAAKRMEELNINKDGGSVCFGQLLGMCDHVSLTLAQEGYIVYKSVPYGSVDDTLPYLVRRAQENRTVLQGIRKERDLLRQELKHRLKLSLKGGS